MTPRPFLTLTPSPDPVREVTLADAVKTLQAIVAEQGREIAELRAKVKEVFYLVGV